jgi:hypothetical protein
MSLEENARRNRDELIHINSQRAAGHWKRVLAARHSSTCPTCAHPIKPGQLIVGFGPRAVGARPTYRHAHCA